MKKDLAKELQERGTAEISNGVVNQVTQALEETENKVTFVQFGELKSQGIIPIDQACVKCDFWKGKFTNTKLCQQSQSKDAQARGFNKLICPNQLEGLAADQKAIEEK